MSPPVCKWIFGQQLLNSVENSQDIQEFNSWWYFRRYYSVVQAEKYHWCLSYSIWRQKMWAAHSIFGVPVFTAARQCQRKSNKSKWKLVKRNGFSASAWLWIWRRSGWFRAHATWRQEKVIALDQISRFWICRGGFRFWDDIQQRRLKKTLIRWTQLSKKKRRM